MMTNILKYALSISLLLTQFCAIAQSDKQVESMMSMSGDDASHKLDTATFGTGCYWCAEAQFQLLNGVEHVESGFSGGHVANPSYHEVCTGTTGHAEVINVAYDPAVISYDELLEAFWKSHDPTTLNQQGNDKGTQYRSVIFYHNAAQEQKAREYKKKLTEAKIWDNPIVTEITAFDKFYKAEDYHQNYYNQNGEQGYCRMVITPKVEKFKKIFKDKLKTSTQ